MYKLKQKGKKFSEDSLYKVNKKIRDKDNESLEFDYFNHKYKVDFINQDLYIDDIKQDIDLPKNKDNARWINFRRVTCSLPHGERTEEYYIGFQVNINSKSYKRMIRINDDTSEIVDNS